MEYIQKALDSKPEEILGSKSKIYRYIISTDHEDRDADVIKQSGWELEEFNRNPVALLNHKHDQPIGKWSNIQTTKTADGKNFQTTADLTLAPPVSDMLKYANALVSEGILNATSVGFAVKSAEKRKAANGMPAKGHIIHKAVLREISVVSVPANPNCIRLMKSLGVSSEIVKSFVTGDIDGVDSDYDIDTPSDLSVALDKANEVLKGFKPNNGFETSVFKRQNRITDPELLKSYENAMKLLKK